LGLARESDPVFYNGSKKCSSPSQKSKVDFTADAVINSAGLYSDKVANMGGETKYKIYPNRGEYLILDKVASTLTSRPIYPVPKKGVGGLGVHLTPTIDGNMLIGPSAEYISDDADFANTKKMMDDMIIEARTLLPEISSNMIIGAYTGMRAKTVPPGSSNFGDFIIEESTISKGLINLVGIESPGLTASMPIAEWVCEILQARLGFKSKEHWIAEYRGNPVFHDLDTDAQNKMIKDNPDYGEIICRCENITKAEVLQALNNALGVNTLVGLKNRVRVMMGRCQGGYCFTNIINIMTKELGIPCEDIMFRNIGDRPVFGRVK
jgi:glycerol-3-phosphate dehydrogenase